MQVYCEHDNGCSGCTKCDKFLGSSSHYKILRRTVLLGVSQAVIQSMIRNVNHESSSEHGKVTVAPPVFPVQAAMSCHAYRILT